MHDVRPGVLFMMLLIRVNSAWKLYARTTYRSRKLLYRNISLHLNIK